MMSVFPAKAMMRAAALLWVGVSASLVAVGLVSVLKLIALGDIDAAMSGTPYAKFIATAAMSLAILHAGFMLVILDRGRSVRSTAAPPIERDHTR